MVARRPRRDDAVLVLADLGWEDSYLRASASIDDNGALLSRETLLVVGVEGERAGAALAMFEDTWEMDVDDVLRELDLQLAGPPEPDDCAAVGDDDLDRVFAAAAELQESERHQEAADLFMTIVRSGTPPLAGRAAYAAGRSYEKLRNSNHAVRAYRDAITLGPRDAAAASAYSLGRFLLGRGEFEEAAATFSEAIELGDDSMRARAQQLRDKAMRRAAES